MHYEEIEHDEIEFVQCLYDIVKAMVMKKETVRLRPIAIHCDVPISELKERQDQIALIELLVRRELDMPDED